MTGRRRSRVPWVIATVGLAVLICALALTALDGNFANDPVIVIASAVGVVAYTVVGALIASRERRNPIGWILMAIGLGFLGAFFTQDWANYAVVTSPGSLPLGSLMTWVQTWAIFIPLASILLLFFLFPTGQLLSPRWRPVAWGAAAGLALGALATMLDARSPISLYVGSLKVAEVANPVGVPALNDAVPVGQAVAGALGFAGLFLAVTSLVLRFRRARGVERQQMRWLSFVGVLGAVSLALALVTSKALGEQANLSLVTFAVFFACLAFAVPIACGLAILRYRLYDLDLVIKKTVIFGILVALIMAAGVTFSLILRPMTPGIAGGAGATASADILLGFLIWPLWRLSRRIADKLVYGGRVSPYEVLSEFSGRVGETYSSDDVLPRMATVLGEATGAEQASVWLSLGTDPRVEAVWPAGSVAPDTLPEDAVEVTHRGERLGALAVLMPPNDPMNPSKERLVHDLAAQAGPVLSNVRLIEELRASRQRLVAAQDEERRKLERNLHDGAQQQLVAMSVQLKLAQTLVDRDAAKAGELLTTLQGTAAQAIEDLRDLARGIYPPLLADRGLPAAIEAQARRAAVPVTVESDGVGRYPQDVEAAVYFSCLEALNNVAKYAGATAATVSLTQPDGQLLFSVVDDGRGFDASGTTYGTGLQGMADRLDAVGGGLRVDSRPHEGTTITGWVPVDEPQEAP
jgi:signal transduction histidine kinase